MLLEGRSSFWESEVELGTLVACPDTTQSSPRDDVPVALSIAVDEGALPRSLLSVHRPELSSFVVRGTLLKSSCGLGNGDVSGLHETLAAQLMAAGGCVIAITSGEALAMTKLNARGG